MKLFVSYSRENLAVAEDIVARLRAAGHKVFFDRHTLPTGQAFDSLIRREIVSSDLFIFLVSPASVRKGGYSRTELRFAEIEWPNPGARVLPVLIQETPIQDVPAYLRALTFFEAEGNLTAELCVEVERRAAKKSSRAVAAAAGLLVAVIAGVVIKYSWPDDGGSGGGKNDAAAVTPAPVPAPAPAPKTVSTPTPAPVPVSASTLAGLSSSKPETSPDLRWLGNRPRTSTLFNPPPAPSPAAPAKPAPETNATPAPMPSLSTTDWYKNYLETRPKSGSPLLSTWGTKTEATAFSLTWYLYVPFGSNPELLAKNNPMYFMQRYKDESGKIYYRLSYSSSETANQDKAAFEAKGSKVVGPALFQTGFQKVVDDVK